jgi:hypothetical protein
MTGLIHSFANPITASGKTRRTTDTIETCRDRAAADLLKSVTMLTANERLILERSATSWSLRADMLEGLTRSAPELAPSPPCVGEGKDHVRL